MYVIRVLYSCIRVSARIKQSAIKTERETVNIHTTKLNLSESPCTRVNSNLTSVLKSIRFISLLNHSPRPHSTIPLTRSFPFHRVSLPGLLSRRSVVHNYYGQTIILAAITRVACARGQLRKFVRAHDYRDRLKGRRCRTLGQ